MERRTYALRLTYDGAAFRGWQREPGQPTVQQAVEDALATLLGDRPVVHGAARTDAGVHAEGQVASFSVHRAPALDELLGLRLPAGAGVVGAARADASFHARASALAKRYRYRFAWGGSQGTREFHLGQAEPDWDRARAALDGLREVPHLAGLSSPSRERSPAPPLDGWSLVAGGGQAELIVRARAFRKHQVRNLAGHLAAVALGLAVPESLARLARGMPPWRGATAPPHGLTLLEVIYPPRLDPFGTASASAAPGPQPR